MAKKVNSYTGADVEIYEGLKGIRERPTMYIQELGTRGVIRLINEVKDNVTDEFMAGASSSLYMEVWEDENKIEITDDGRGMPIDKAFELCTKLHAGAKFKSLAYVFKGGLNGIGIKAVNALSDYFKIEIHRDNQKYVAVYSKGELQGKEVITKEPNQKVTGTKVTFVPDKTVMGNYKIKIDMFKDYLTKVAYVNKGLSVVYVGHKGKKTIKEKYYSKNGITEYLNKFIVKDKPTAINTPIYINKIVERVKSSHPEATTGFLDMGFETTFTWLPKTRGYNVLSFVNGIETGNDGYHVSGLLKGICNVIRDDFKDGKFLAKKDPLNKFINRDDFLDGFNAVLVTLHQKPLFDGQTKNKFSSIDYEPFAEKCTQLKFKEWTNLNKNKYKSIIDSIILSAKARYAAYSARNKVKSTSTPVASISGIPGFSACHSKNPKECELFIVEGDSAGGSAKTCGDSRVQAIFPAFGVPANTYSMSDITKLLKTTGRSSIRDLVTVFGCGFGTGFDISKLNFHKIIIMSDADADGGHIKSLHLGFLYKYYKPVIEAGYVYLANPPLFQLKARKKHIYVANMDEYNKISEGTIYKEFELCAYDKRTKKIKSTSKGFFKVYLTQLRNYFDIMKGISDQLKINPQLLEYVITNWNNINKYKRFMIDKNEFVRIKDKSGWHLEGIYDEIFHRIDLDDNFFIQSVQPIVDKLHHIKWDNLILKHRKTNKYLGPSHFKIASGINYLLNHSIDVTRFKGLGEMNPKQLWDTTMNPETRTLTKVKIDSFVSAETDEMLDILIGNNLEGRKTYYRNVLGLEDK